MFDQLFGSKTRVKLLSLFLNNPGRPYYVREITRKIDEQINSVRRELSNLLSIGIIKSESSNNRLYYEVEQSYQYFKELKAIFSTIPVTSKAIRETKDEDQVVKKLRSCGKIDLAFLTGGFVRQDHLGIDLLVVGDVNRAKMAKIAIEMERDLGRELNYTIMTPQDYNYRLNLNDRFLSNVMEAKKIMLIDGDDAPIEHSDIKLEDGEQLVPVKVEKD